jgi:hypothetical protein
MVKEKFLSPGEIFSGGGPDGALSGQIFVSGIDLSYSNSQDQIVLKTSGRAKSAQNRVCRNHYLVASLFYEKTSNSGRGRIFYSFLRNGCFRYMEQRISQN